MFSAFNPSKWSSGQPTLRSPGSSWGFGALLKGLTSVVDTSCQSRDSNPQPWVTSSFKSNALSIRPQLPRMSIICTLNFPGIQRVHLKSLWNYSSLCRATVTQSALECSLRRVHPELEQPPS